jgi:hypothetical protein
MASTEIQTGGPEHWGADSKLPRLGASTFAPSEPPAIAAPIPSPKGMKERAIELDKILDDEILDPNPKLHRFRAQRLDNVEYVADVAFLEHVLHTLITNHNLTVTPADIEAMLSYFGECAVNTRIEHYMTRDVDAEPKCCGTTAKQREQAIEVIKSVVLNGLNIAKSIPSMQQFMGRLGIGF